MKKTIFFIVALLVVMATGCEKEPKSLADIKNATPADSMMYFLGEMVASNYWKDAQTDTMLGTQKAREQYNKGLREGLKRAKESVAYNKGLAEGVRLAIRIQEFERRYDVEFPEKILAAAVKNTLESDNRNMVAESQQNFYHIKNRFESKAAGREGIVAKQRLETVAGEEGYSRVNDSLYVRDITPSGGGELFRDGEQVNVSISASTIYGKEIVTVQYPDIVTIGEGRLPEIIAQGLRTMTDGQTRTFITTPRTLLGRKYNENYHIPYEEPVRFTVKATRN